MNAIILAAGFGTRLRPWTEKHPKALVPVNGEPMLSKVIKKLIDEGFNRIVINTHHFAEQIEEYIGTSDFKAEIKISKELPDILDTGGGVKKALGLFNDKEEPVLVHNVDILSDAPLSRLRALHKENGCDISLITSDRKSSRKLIFNKAGKLKGWHNLNNNETKPESFVKEEENHESAFSGIYFINPSIEKDLNEYSKFIGKDSFPIMDFLLDSINKNDIGEIKLDKLNLIDIGKPETLALANGIFNENDDAHAVVGDACDADC